MNDHFQGHVSWGPLTFVNTENLKLVSAIFYLIFISHQMIAVQKL